MFRNSISKFSMRILVFETNKVVASTQMIRLKTAGAVHIEKGRPPTKLLDAFDVLNLERKFDIPPDTLKHSYRSLMATLHPDKHHGKPLAEQEALKEKASEVTQSYQILREAPTRATHMLQLSGKVDSMEESSMRELLNASQGNMLLMEVMELREAIEDAENDQVVLKTLLEENNERLQSVCGKLASAFSAQDMDQALELTVMLQYYNRIDETIRSKMDER